MFDRRDSCPRMDDIVTRYLHPHVSLPFRSSSSSVLSRFPRPWIQIEAMPASGTVRGARRAARGRSRRGCPRRELAWLLARRVRLREARATEGPPVGHLILAGQIRQAPRSNSASPRRKSRRPAPATASDPGQPPSCRRRSFSLPRLSSHGWDK